MNFILRRVGARKLGALFCAGLIGLLAMLFFKSFLPDYVVFSNDVPLGLRNSGYLRTSGLSGAWSDLNSIGQNGGALAPNISTLLHRLLSPLVFSKWFPPITLAFLGFGAFLFFRRQKLAPLACVLGGLATALCSTFFSAACWGVGTQCFAYGLTFLALALVVDRSIATWIRYILAGFCVGLGVTEGFDIGAILSIFVAGFALYHTLACGPSLMPLGRRIALGLSRVAILAIFAGLTAAYALSFLVSTQIRGVAGLQETAEAKARRWDWATQWSFPKAETLGLFMPGILGYRMDTPEGGNYWGAMGRDPAWDRYFEGGKEGEPPQGFMRFSGGGVYAGVSVVLIALWATLQAFRKNSIFSPFERRLLWFWIGAGAISLLLAYGRFAPFYRLFYELPYMSAIRNPTKFIVIFSFSLLILFAYGVHGLSARYLEVPGTYAPSLAARLTRWWAKAAPFERRWVAGCIGAVTVSLLGWLIYYSSRGSLIQHLQTVQFDESAARAIAEFSVKQVGWFILFLIASVALMILILSGALAGRNSRWAGILLGLVLVFDLARANLPWIQYVDYPQKYASNPVIDTLRQQPYEHRVAILPFRSPAELALFDQIYRIEWAQHQFPFYNVQSLDIVQMPRVPQDLQNFESALQFRGTADSTYLLTRRWALTNTRYLLGPAGFLDVLNQQIDPDQRRFRIVESFNVVPKAGVLRPTRLEELTAEPATNGAYALFEFTGALPRAQLYSHWQVPAKDPSAVAKLKSESWNTNDLSFLKSIGTNDFLTLETLAARDFDPHKTVLLADTASVPATTNAASQNSGTVEYTSYAPKEIRLKTQSKTDSVLLLNDKYDPAWQVSVDGKRVDMLRANYIMRGVFVPAGEHTVEFQFKMDIRPLYISLAAEVLAVGLLGFVTISRRKPSAAQETPPAAG